MLHITLSFTSKRFHFCILRKTNCVEAIGFPCLVIRLSMIIKEEIENLCFSKNSTFVLFRELSISDLKGRKRGFVLMKGNWTERV